MYLSLFSLGTILHHCSIKQNQEMTLMAIHRVYSYMQILIIFQSITCLFILFKGSFIEQTFLILVMFNLSVFPFYNIGSSFSKGGLHITCFGII